MLWVAFSAPDEVSRILLKSARLWMSKILQKADGDFSTEIGQQPT